jgi:hypothetical protein
MNEKFIQEPQVREKKFLRMRNGKTRHVSESEKRESEAK